MGIKERLIKKLEKDVEFDAGHIDLDNLNEEERNKLFIRFGEGNRDLTNFLKTAYNHNAPSVFCCSGHGGRKDAFVVLKVNDDNIELLRKIGKVLSKHNIVTNFENNHVRGPLVQFRVMNNNPSTEWFNIASQIMERPDLFDDSNPTKYYHEKMTDSYKPLFFDLKKKLLNQLRGKKNEILPERKIY